MAQLGKVDLEIDVTELREQFSVDAINAALSIALERTGAVLMERIRRGFQVGGWDPKSGTPGFWPERKVPDKIQKAYEEWLDAGKAPNKFELNTAKTKRGVIRRMRPKEPDPEKPGKYQPQMLIETGRYMDSIALKVSNTPGAQEATVGVDDTAVPYAKWQEYGVEQFATARQAAFLRQLGFTIWEHTKITLPARRVFVMPDPWRKDLTAILSEQFMENLTDGSSQP